MPTEDQMLQREIDTLTDGITALTDEIDELKRSIAIDQERLADLEAELAGMKSVLAQTQASDLSRVLIERIAGRSQPRPAVPSIRNQTVHRVSHARAHHQLSDEHRTGRRCARAPALLPDACSPLVFFDPQHRSVLDHQQYGNEGRGRQQARIALPAMATPISIRAVARSRGCFRCSGI